MFRYPPNLSLFNRARYSQLLTCGSLFLACVGLKIQNVMVADVELVLFS